MPNKYWNKTNIFGLAGILAYAVTTLVLFIPFKGEPSMSLIDWQSPLGIVVITLFVISIVLYIWAICRREHHLTPREAADLLESRKQYLPQLKDNATNKTKQLEYIRDMASNKITFSEYLTKYVSDPSKLNIKIYGLFYVLREYMLIGFKVGSAMWNNLYYEDLKKADDVLRPLETEYDLLVSQVKDKNLKNKLNEYWDIVDKTNSRIIFEQMMRQIDTLTPMRRNLVNIVEKLYSRKLKPITIRRINDRIDELLYGELDE